MDNLEITTALDQSIVLEEDSVFKEVDENISTAIRNKDAEQAFMFCKEKLVRIKRESFYLAKALWMISKAWDVFQLGDDFMPTAQDYLGIHPHTIERYIKVWEMLVNYVPAQFKEELQQKNINSLIPAANAVARGIDLNEKDWKDIVDAPDRNTVQGIVRKIEGGEPRKNNLTLKLDVRGSIWAYTGKGDVVFVGSLEVEDENEYVKKAVERIISNSGILRG